jgi:Carboxypeptidase regulatory-like domain
MSPHPRWTAIAALPALLMAGLCARGAQAQLQTGNLYGRVADETGTPLSGATVTLYTGEAPEVRVTNAQGEFRFLGLPPATYRIKAELQGFAAVEHPNLVVDVGRNSRLEVTMSPAVPSFTENVVIVDQPPLLDEKIFRVGAIVSQDELRGVPNTRDPWSVLQSIPGVLTDRMNIGGSESGQQAAYIGPGSLGAQSVWAVDGVVITDMAATGATPAYYDFDSFQEMQISTGGSDSTIATGGVVLNLVTRRGTNEVRGSARFLDVSKSTQSTTSFDNRSLPAGQPPIKIGNQIDKIEDYGAEAGGPLVNDHLWVWGSYARTSVDLIKLGGTTDKTLLPAWNAKLNAQLGANNSLTLFGLDSDKQKHGRNAGPTRLQPTTWDQGVFGGSPTLLKAEDSHIFGPDLYAIALYSHVYGGFALIPESGIGPGTPAAYQDIDGVWHNSFLFNTNRRPQTQEKLEASSFFGTGRLGHELKYGASYRTAEQLSNANWAGGGLILDPSQDAATAVPAGLNGLYLTRAALDGTRTTYSSGYAEDTIAAGRLTANLGLRYDLQRGTNLAETVPANPLRPDLLPAVAYAGGGIGFRWQTLSPRLGLTYAFGPQHSTLLRASYSRFADQLSQDVNHAGILDPLGNLSLFYTATTNPGDGHLTPGQVAAGPGVYSANVDPRNPAALLQPNAVSRGLSAPLTDELLLGGQHALAADFVVGANLTYRLQRHLLQQDQLVYDDPDPNDPATFDSLGRVATRADYLPHTLLVAQPGGRTASVTYYELRPGVTTHKGLFLHNGDYGTAYEGASLVFHKRLSGHWMLRGNLTWSDWKYDRAGDRPDPTLLVGGGLTDGNYVARDSIVVQSSGIVSGAKADVYINSRWSFAVNGMVQIAPERPWGFNLAGNLTGRQGYPTPWFVAVLPDGNAAPENVQVGGTDSHRVDDIVDFDARIEKQLSFDAFGVTLGVDCFNLLNESYVLQRKNRLFDTASAAPVHAGFVDEILSPRIFRFGVRLSFR